jgi:phosphate uptake regulator
MEIRKVQMTGGSSYVVTLPKSWVVANGIQKNDPIGMMVHQDGSLIVTSNTEGEKTHTSKTIDLAIIDNPSYLLRILLGSYIQGYSVIEVVGKPPIDPLLRDTVTDFTKLTVGPEIIEEDDRSIGIKDLLDPTEMPFENTIKRLFILIRAMHQDGIGALKSGDHSVLAEIIQRDDDVDRLHWLIARQSNIAMSDTQLARRMGIRAVDAIYFFLISRIMERIGDHAVAIAGNADILLKVPAKPTGLKNIEEASGFAMELFTESINAWSKKDISAANSVLDRLKELRPMCEKINRNAMKMEGEFSIAESYIAESIRRTGEYSGDIAELTINYLIRERE